MAEYIEREAVVERLLKVCMTDDVYGMGIQRGVDHALDVLRETPAADVVEVVRCFDCKHYHLETAYCDKHSYFVDSDGVSCSPAESPNWTMWDADDYCRHGERRDDRAQ